MRRESWAARNYARILLQERPQDIPEILRIAAGHCEFAYEHGMHEDGIPIPDMLRALAEMGVTCSVLELAVDPSRSTPNGSGT